MNASGAARDATVAATAAERAPQSTAESTHWCRRISRALVAFFNQRVRKRVAGFTPDAPGASDKIRPCRRRLLSSGGQWRHSRDGIFSPAQLHYFAGAQHSRISGHSRGTVSTLAVFILSESSPQFRVRPVAIRRGAEGALVFGRRAEERSRYRSASLCSMRQTSIMRGRRPSSYAFEGAVRVCEAVMEKSESMVQLTERGCIAAIRTAHASASDMGTFADRLHSARTARASSGKTKSHVSYPRSTHSRIFSCADVAREGETTPPSETAPQRLARCVVHISFLRNESDWRHWERSARSETPSDRYGLLICTR